MIDETAEEIREMQTHSSSVVAVKAAEALASLTDREFASVGTYLRDLDRNSAALRRANPSHASLHTTQREIVEAVETADPESLEEAKRITREAADRVIERVQRSKREAADNAAERFADGETYLTHDYSSTVLAAVETAVDAGKGFEAYVTEARPRYLGRKTARRLGEIDGVDTHLLVDSAAGCVLAECDRVVVGMDCIVGDTLYNRVGTFPICATADRMDVPVTVVGSQAKVIETGFVFENEYRPASEVMLEPAEGFGVENPAYDATPMDLVDEVITD
jgi:translation initiation factor eIF-2B subunit delta